jgi:hypothetical protein
MMKRSSYIGTIVAAVAIGLGVLGAPGDGDPADATRPTSPRDRPEQREGLPQRGPNDADYHADYHADYRATGDSRLEQPTRVGRPPDPRRDSRRFRDEDRAIWTPHGWRR